MDIINSNILSDQDLQCIVTHINTAHLNVINLIKKSAEKENTPFTARGLSSLLQLSQEEINDIFLNSISSHQPIFNVMLEMGADINTQNKNGENCLFYTSNPKILNRLIAQGANVHCRNTFNETPLIHHCYFNLKPKLLSIFLEAGADPDSVQNQNAQPLLYRAIKQNCIPSVKLLCDHKADVNGNLRKYTKNPLMLSLIRIREPINYEIVEILLRAGAIADCHDDFKDKNDYYRYALHHVTGWPELKIFNKKLILLLLEHGANPNRPYPFTEGKDYPLHQAVIFKHLVVITALLKHGAHTDYRNQKGLTPLELAKSTHCSEDIITLLSQHTTITPEDEPVATTNGQTTIALAHNRSENKRCTIQ